MFKANINDIQESLHNEKCGCDYSEDYQEEDDFPLFEGEGDVIKPTPKSEEYVLAHLPGLMKCNRCGEPVLKSSTDGYTYQCLNCDEDLFSFEASPLKAMTPTQLATLIQNAKDTLLLD